MFLTSWFRSPDVPKVIGEMTATGYTSWVKVKHFPGTFYATVTGDLETTPTSTCSFQFGDEDENGNVVLAAKEGTAISLSGIGDANCASTLHPKHPFKYVRGYVSAISSTAGVKVTFRQVLGGA